MTRRGVNGESGGTFAARSTTKVGKQTRTNVYVPDQPTPAGLVRRYASMGGHAHYSLAGVTRGSMVHRSLCGITCPYGTAYGWQVDYVNQLPTCARCVTAGASVASRL